MSIVRRKKSTQDAALPFLLVLSQASGIAMSAANPHPHRYRRRPSHHLPGVSPGPVPR